MEKISFAGKVASMHPRIKLLRSFDQVPTHQYQGYILCIEGTIESEEAEFRVAIGPKAQEKHQIQAGDNISGKAVPIPNPTYEWAQYYRVSAIKLTQVGDRNPPSPDGGVPVPLPAYREHGHLRLDKKTAASSCSTCPWSAFMTTEMIVDHWNPSKKKYRIESHCYGPGACPNYRPGRPYTVPGRGGLKYTDDDYERFQSGDS